MPLVERNQVHGLYSSGAVRQCVAAVESLFLASGGTALQETHPLQQLNRDIKAMAVCMRRLAHENNLELWGASILGKPLNSANSSDIWIFGVRVKILAVLMGSE